jgi:hypothetical protein
MKKFLNKKLYPLIVLTVFICTIFFYISNKIESDIFLRIINLFFSIYILLIIGLGVYKFKLDNKINFNKNITLTLLANGIIIYTIYVVKLLSEGINIGLKEYLTLIVTFIAIILLVKIHFETNDKKNVA